MVLAGLMPPSLGTVRFRIALVREPPLGVSVVFQDYSRLLLPWKSAREHVTLGMRRLGLARAAARFFCSMNRWPPSMPRPAPIGRALAQAGAQVSASLPACHP